uniref:inhibitor of growth protein 5 n=1 Tax=Ictidomys tridecemlineatus TaxID=43179 RepID=UPI00067FFDC3|nr:inhibitor of growth protein 5 [Ictidomys tridecemlineatus]
MRELDQRTEDKKAEIDLLAAEYISTVKTLSPDQRVAHLQKIQSAYSKCKEYSDDKVQLAMQTYEMVDKHIRRLDADLARFEADLKDKMDGNDFDSPGGRGLKKGRGQKEKRGSRGRGRRTSEEDTPKKKKHKGGSEFTDTILSVHPSDVLDMPVDPNEPTYCLCHQVSYGEMIGCDNPDVRIENLPCELQRNFQLMRELDQRTEDKKAEIDLLAAEYISTVKTLSPDQRVAHLQKIQSAYSKCKEYSDDKVQLAMQTYEMVLSTVRSGQEEEEVRKGCIPGEMSPQALSSTSQYVFDFKTTLFN